MLENGGLAQLGEHLPCKQGVESSNLLVSMQKRLLLSFILMYLENFTQIKIFLKYRPNKPIEINNESSMLFLVITSNKGKHKVITLYNL